MGLYIDIKADSVSDLKRQVAELHAELSGTSAPASAAKQTKPTAAAEEASAPTAKKAAKKAAPAAKKGPAEKKKGPGIIEENFVDDDDLEDDVDDFTTEEDLRKAVTAHIAAHGQASAKKIIKKLGHGSVAGIPEEDRQEVIDALSAE